MCDDDNEKDDKEKCALVFRAMGDNYVLFTNVFTLFLI